MSYDVPVYSDFITRFPIFSDVTRYPESLITAILTEASGLVDTDWVERDYRPAIMYAAAHLLATDNSMQGDSPEIGATGAIASESFGGMSISYDRSNAASDKGASSYWRTTVYGRRYYYLLKLNKPAIVSV